MRFLHTSRYYVHFPTEMSKTLPRTPPTPVQKQSINNFLQTLNETFISFFDNNVIPQMSRDVLREYLR